MIPRVVIGTIHSDYLSALYVKSLLHTLVTGDPLKRAMFNGQSVRYHGGVNLDIARNEVARIFLELDADYLMFIDSDECWDPDELVAFVVRADTAHREVTSGVVHTFKGDDEVIPVKRLPTEDRWMTPEDIEPLEFPFEAHSVPAGALLIHREVLEAVEAGRWFSKGDSGLSEDLAFCERVRERGFKLWVDPAFRLGHVKLRII